MENYVNQAFLKLKNDQNLIDNKVFQGWEMRSASETRRPGLFSPNYNTFMAYKHRRLAELPDAEECAKILLRLENKNYGTPFVDMEESNLKLLFEDIMKHLNH